MAEGHPAAAADPVPLRIWYCLSLAVWLAAVLTVSHIAKPYEKIFHDLEMRNLPAPAEAMLSISGLIRTPAGSALVALTGLVLIGLACRGVFDRGLKKMILFNVIWVLLLIPFTYLSLHMPIAKIEQNLRETR